MRRYWLYFGLTLVSVRLANAQEPGLPQNCHGMFTATVASGRPHGDVKACAPYVLPEVAAAITGIASLCCTARVPLLPWGNWTTWSKGS